MTINKEGYGIISWTLVIALILLGGAYALVRFAGMAWWGFWIIAGLIILSIFSVLCFFREPSRQRITDDELVFSPADGKIVVIEKVEEKEFLKEKCIQVSVFMSLANVHINWYPVGGKVIYRKDHPGEYMVAWHPKSSEENERMTTVVDTGKEKILFRQIAGMLARRIVNYAEVGHDAGQNTKCGFIKFGSRVDVFLPVDSEILVKLGDKVTGSLTPLAKLRR